MGAFPWSTTEPQDCQHLAESDPVRLIWGFVALGIVLRLVRFAVGYPLWHDEAFLAANFLDRDFLDFVGQPLDFGQIAPLLFLWAERAAVDALGFHEFSLRFVPTGLALASVPLFAWASGLVLRGRGRLFAVAIFAVAFYPIRHGGEVKPYAGDLFAAVALLGMGLAFIRRPSSTASLWLLAGLAPGFLGLSNPSVFVAGGVLAAIALPAWRSGRWPVRGAFALAGLSVIGSFALYQILCTGAQAGAVGSAYREGYWSDGFPPPVWHPVELGAWLVQAFTGLVLAYPVGSENGGSVVTAVAVVVGVVAMARSGRIGELAVLLAPLGLGLLAAGLGKYPFGPEPRLVQYLAPSFCLLAGLGIDRGLARLARSQPARARRLAFAFTVVLAGIGTSILARDLTRPYRDRHDVQVRDFALRFWTERADSAVLVCARTDLGLAFHSRNWEVGPSALYLCYHRIASERHQRGQPPRVDQIGPGRPVRIVLFNESPEDWPEAARWLDSLGDQFRLARREDVEVDPDAAVESWKRQVYHIFELRRIRNGKVSLADLQGSAVDMARASKARDVDGRRR